MGKFDEAKLTSHRLKDRAQLFSSDKVFLFLNAEQRATKKTNNFYNSNLFGRVPEHANGKKEEKILFWQIQQNLLFRVQTRTFKKKDCCCFSPSSSPPGHFAFFRIPQLLTFSSLFFFYFFCVPFCICWPFRSPTSIVSQSKNPFCTSNLKKI
jgi:hypothetical protein